MSLTRLAFCCLTNPRLTRYFCRFGPMLDPSSVLDGAYCSLEVQWWHQLVAEKPSLALFGFSDLPQLREQPLISRISSKEIEQLIASKPRIAPRKPKQRLGTSIDQRKFEIRKASRVVMPRESSSVRPSGDSANRAIAWSEKLVRGVSRPSARVRRQTFVRSTVE